MKLTPKVITVFQTIAANDGHLTRTTLAEQTGLSVSTVSLYLTALRSNELVDTINGKYHVASNDTAQAAKHDVASLGVVDRRQPDPNSKMSQARKLFSHMAHQPRKVILAAMTANCGLTPQAAATYLQKFRSENGLVRNSRA